MPTSRAATFGGILDFRNSSTADHCTISVTGGAAGADYGSPPETYFTDNATAADAVITTTGGTIPLGDGGLLEFFGSSTADSATITNQGGAVSGAKPGTTIFSDTATAGDATLIANGGVDGADGGLILFLESATGDTGRFEMSANGTLDISLSFNPAVIVGSIEGDGVVSLGPRMLSVGGNNLSTTFAGVIQDSDLGGALTKTGSGTLTLTGSNSYTGGTTVTGGTLRMDNQIGSATGTGPVSVASGTLGGSGTIGGTTTIGDGKGPRAFLAPAAGTKTPSTLAVESSILLKNDAIYIYRFKARNQKSLSDEVVANGVTIEQNATLRLSGSGNGALAQGLSFTVFNNTAATPIAGTFSNLPDGGIVTINGTNFQASYEGGDGNDLTLTVVP